MARILFYVDQFYLGGGSRVASILINGLIERNHEVLVFTDTSKPFTYKLKQETTIIGCKLEDDSKGGIRRFVSRLTRMRNQIKTYNPDVIIAFLANEFFEIYLASFGLGIPIIASDHTSMGRDLGPRINFIRKRLYSLAKHTTILTKKDFKILGKRNPGKIVVYNPLTFEPVDNMPLKEKTILCVGRIDAWEVKGFDIMLKIWSNINNQFPEWRLKIAGPGSENSICIIKQMINKLNCEDSVILLGQVNDMEYEYSKAAIFALSSRVEGFPMVLTEAMSQGCACISFEMQGAVKEIITNEVDGIIIKDRDENVFTNKLAELMHQNNYRLTLGKGAINNVKKFSTTHFMEKWETIISSALKR